MNNDTTPADNERNRKASDKIQLAIEGAKTASEACKAVENCIYHDKLSFTTKHEQQFLNKFSRKDDIEALKKQHTEARDLYGKTNIAKLIGEHHGVFAMVCDLSFKSEEAEYWKELAIGVDFNRRGDDDGDYFSDRSLRM
jgi:hypothetical protein